MQDNKQNKNTQKDEYYDKQLYINYMMSSPMTDGEEICLFLNNLDEEEGD